MLLLLCVYSLVLMLCVCVLVVGLLVDVVFMLFFGLILSCFVFVFLIVQWLLYVYVVCICIFMCCDWFCMFWCVFVVRIMFYIIYLTCLHDIAEFLSVFNWCWGMWDVIHPCRTVRVTRMACYCLQVEDMMMTRQFISHASNLCWTHVNNLDKAFQLKLVYWSCSDIWMIRNIWYVWRLYYTVVVIQYMC